MKRYIDTLHAKEPHQKREFAAHAAAGLTAVVALIWLSTLPMRLMSGGAQTNVADTSASNLVAATAEAGAAFQNQVQNYDQSQTAQPSVQSVGQNAGAGNSGLYAATTTDTTDTGGATMIGSPDSKATTLNQ